jgi:putative ABC transport system permease protein
MWRNYLTVGLRSLTKNRTYAFINIVGLAIGLVACLLLLLYVRYETSYDAWLPNSDRVYQFQTHYSANDRGGEEMNLQMASYASGSALKKDFPQIERAVYMMGGANSYIYHNGEARQVENARFTDGNMLELLQLPLVHGDRATALERPGQLALSQSEARRWFGDANPIGQRLTIVQQNRPTDYTVSAVFEDLPPNTHLAISMLARFDPQSFYADAPYALSSWNSQSGWWYAMLRQGANVDEINAALPAWERRNIPDDVDEGVRHNPGTDQDWQLTNVRDVHLGEAQRASMRPGNDRATVITFAIIALLILAMACVNFTNLATARASQRAREVALRKVLGANRRQLILQFLAESVLVTTIAMLLALGLLELLLPAFNAFLNANIEVDYFGEKGLLLPIVLLILLVGAAGGAYPAFYLARFQPAQILKANKSSSEAQGSGRLRNILVIGQFAVSIGLMICTAVVYAQTVYARSIDPGFNRDSLIQVEIIGRERVDAAVDSLLNELKRIPGVTAVGRTNIGVATPNNSATNVRLAGETRDVMIGSYGIDPGFFDAMGMHIIAGRNFSDNVARDDSTTPFPVQPEAERAIVARGINVVLTESAARRLGWSPQEAIGKEIRTGLTLPEYGLVPATVIGVVNDARFRSIRDPLQPIMFNYQKTFFNAVEIRFNSNDPAAMMRQVEAVWRRVIPDVPFRAAFADDRIVDMYKAEAARSQIFAGFSLLAVVVACLGLFGLAAFTAERRTKEIGIRKVLGARTRDIVRLLAWQFSKPVIIANLIAWPIAWYVMHGWLNTFQARVDLGVAPFLLAGALALGIALATIASHAFRVARANPINALRYE